MPLEPSLKSCLAMLETTEPWHGTRTGYQRKKCKCDACREWNRELRRKYTKRDIDDLARQPRMTTAEKVAEIEWIRSTDTVDNIAVRLGWKDFDDMFTVLRRAGYGELVDSLRRQREAPKAMATARLSDNFERLYFD